MVANGRAHAPFDTVSPGCERRDDFLVSANLNSEFAPLTGQARCSAKAALVGAHADKPIVATDASMAVVTAGPIGHIVGFSDYVHDADCSSYPTFCQEMLHAGFPRNADVIGTAQRAFTLRLAATLPAALQGGHLFDSTGFDVRGSRSVRL